MTEFQKYLERLAKPGIPPGAIQALSKIGALAASVSRSSGLTSKADRALAEISRLALNAGTQDEIAYWDQNERSKDNWVRKTPESTAAYCLDIASHSCPTSSANPIDTVVAKLVSVAASACCQAIADHNDPMDADAMAITAACGPNSSPIDVVIAAGATVIDSAGTRYLDASSGLWNCPLGHGHPAPLNGFLKQSVLVSSINPFTQTSPILRLAAEKVLNICKMDGGGVFFCSSGSEAVETALRFGLSVQGFSSPIYALPGSFHGATLGASMLSSYSSLWREYQGIEKIVEHKIPEQWVEKGLGFIEPIKMGAGVQRSLDGDLLRKFRSKGGVVVVDEIACGLGRTYWPLASHELNIPYDIVLLGKGLANGLVPIACVAVSAEIRMHLEKTGVDFGHTHSNHLASASAALQTISILDGLNHSEIHQTFANAFSRLSVLTVIEGATAAVWLNGTFPRSVVEQECRNEGILIHLPTVVESVEKIIVAPPLVIETSELHEVVRRVRNVISKLEKSR